MSLPGAAWQERGPSVDRRRIRLVSSAAPRLPSVRAAAENGGASSERRLERKESMSAKLGRRPLAPWEAQHRKSFKQLLPLAAPPPQLHALFDEVSAAMAAERAAGHAIGAHQPADSAARLDAAVRAAVRAYIAAGHDDWRRLATFNDSHYVRHLIDLNDDFEMIVSRAARAWHQQPCGAAHPQPR